MNQPDDQQQDRTLKRSGSAPSVFHLPLEDEPKKDKVQQGTSVASESDHFTNTTHDNSYMIEDLSLCMSTCDGAHQNNSDIDLKEHDEQKESHNHHGSSAPASFGRGIVADIKQTIGTHWREEMTNFNLKTVAVSFFLFFACIAPAITFGAIYEKATHNSIGATEMITATAWCGIVYALIGGQPMMINGGTGPVLAFTEIIYKMSKSMDVPFLTFNAWIGLWVCLYMFLAAFFDLNRIIKYATRFTDEIFSLLISAIFIINALGSPFAPVGIYYYFERDHSSHEKHEEVVDYSYTSSALLSVLICLGTVQLAFSLRRAKFSPYMNQIVRNVVTDFAVVIAIAVMSMVANILFPDIETETLNVPESFAPTYACCTKECHSNWPDDCPELDEPYGQRPWLVDLSDVNGKSWVPFMAAGPALLAFILVFLDDGITWHLINHPTHKLQHGDAFNYDTLIVGAMIAVNSILGLPWLVAATVRSLNHINAMAEKSPEGKILSIQETRLTHLGIHILCLVSIFALDLLKVIPVPILYGVFLFMGLVSLATNQFWCRVNMLFMEPSKYPRETFTQFVETHRMHYFTAIQLFLFVLLYTVKAIKTIAIAFPLIIACCIPIRLYVLPRIFTEDELVMLDGDDAAINASLKRMAEEAAQNTSEEEDDEEMQNGGDKDDLGGEPDSSIFATETDASVTSRPYQEAKEDEIDVDDYNEHDGEKQDLVPPLPSETGALRITEPTSQAKRSARRKSRKKSVSCPSGVLFAVPPPVVVHQQASSDAGDSSTVNSEENAAAPLRRRRVKSLSCPTHQLFMEAERHIASNYFFG